MKFILRATFSLLLILLTTCTGHAEDTRKWYYTGVLNQTGESYTFRYETLDDCQRSREEALNNGTITPTTVCLHV